MIELCSSKDCTGCGACMNACPKHAISMCPDSEGFLQPVITHSLCIECKLCQKVCHVLNPLVKHPKVKNPLAALAKSDEIRQKSSSGGIFSLFATQILLHKGVVFGAVFNEDYDVIHRKATNLEELSALRGSKYVQSNTLDTYKEVKAYLKQSIDVLYTGTACQIAGLYRFLGKADLSHLYTVDLVCHGVPSPKSFHLYLLKLAEKEQCAVKDIQNFSFRDLRGWNVTPSFKINNERTISNQPVAENLYMSLFLTSRLNRECCYQCQYATNDRVSDITIADFWGIGDEKPFVYNTSNGCSLVLLNSKKGETLFREIEEQLEYDVREWSEALAQNHQLYTPSTRPKDRDKVYSYFEKHSYDETYTYFFNNYSIRFRRLIGSLLKRLHLR